MMKRFKNIFLLTVLSVLLVSGFTASSAQAQESQILSVTPPLFQLSILPGDAWQSGIKVVNGNDYPMTVYAEVVNFSATGEGGQGNFIPILEPDPDGPTLAHWIDIQPGPYVIGEEQTTNIPFIIDIPEDAAPGGHYAAVLVSTETKDDTDTIALLTSQAVTSLFFIKVEGATEEKGLIRELSVIDSFVEKLEVDISLRFDNKGNVHLQPRGEIIITNMWGAERGVIPVNYQTHFGNVLPNSTRDFRFQWESDFKITDVGRYKVDAALTYGEDEMKSATATTHFWVIPIKSTLITLLVIGLFVTLIVLMIKAYIRKMLTLAGVDPARVKKEVDSDYEYDTDVEEKRQVPVSAPLKYGVLDLRRQLSNVEESFDMFRTVIRFIVDYKKFFLSVLILVIIFVVGVMYIGQATEEDRNYNVSVEDGTVSAIVDEED